MRLGLQKIKTSVLLFLDANSKSRRFGRYLQNIPKPGRELYALHCNLEFSVTPLPPALIIEFDHGKSLEFQIVFYKIRRAPPSAW